MSSLSTFKFDPKLTAVIEQLKGEINATSKSEVIRRAITLLKLVQEANERGDELVILEKGGDKTRIIIS